MLVNSEFGGRRLVKVFFFPGSTCVGYAAVIVPHSPHNNTQPVPAAMGKHRTLLISSHNCNEWEPLWWLLLALKAFSGPAIPDPPRPLPLYFTFCSGRNLAEREVGLLRGELTPEDLIG